MIAAGGWTLLCFTGRGVSFIYLFICSFIHLSVIWPQQCVCVWGGGVVVALFSFFFLLLQKVQESTTGWPRVEMEETCLVCGIFPEGAGGNCGCSCTLMGVLLHLAFGLGLGNITKISYSSFYIPIRCTSPYCTYLVNLIN